MAKIYTCGDTHFGHDNLLKPTYDNRPFATVEDMNEHFISEWNKAVGPNDIMLFMGDFFFRGITLIDDIFPRLNGQIVEIKGNHCYNKQLRCLAKYSNYGCVRHEDFWYNGFHFWCAHNPCDAWYNDVDWSDWHNVRLSAHWHSQAPCGPQLNYSGTPWARGHQHQTPMRTDEVYLPGWSYNVSLDVIGYKPISLDQICDDIVKAQNNARL